MIKDSLKNRIRNRLTASQILAAVTRISDNDNQDNTKYPMLNALLTFRDSAISSANDSTSLLIIIICLMLLIILILLNISIMKNSHLCARKRYEASRSNDNLLELSLKQPTEVYTTQALIRSEKKKQNTLPSSIHATCNQPFLNELKRHYSVTESLDSGIVDRELEENEYNARILEQRRMKSKLRILHQSYSDNSILNPVQLQLTGSNAQLYATKSYQY
ncbi:hypothetical protein X798_00717 [Onchocerca flexuosa]|uniref:Uncharacterized protein n=1 Tax=Onchocerca flexuosa TaxID=387005 RepID=A0A238C4V3_9BILA|nr:hypothetical protein X798_00717 [Onchocerca flexuosa]